MRVGSGMTPLESLVMEADEHGYRLEMVGGLGIWEAHPALKHQLAVDTVRSGIQRPSGGSSDCGCFHVADIYVRFADGSLKRPDISLFCRKPDEEEGAVTLIPDAVIEIISKGYEAKDLEIGPGFYLSQGVKDVVIFDPYSLEIVHVRKDGERKLVSPTTIQFECGCSCEL
jgi:hypothetical protein